MDRLYEEMRRVIADPAVEVVPSSLHNRPVSPPSRIDSEMFRALERTQKSMFPPAITIPAMLTGATDNAQLRTKGVQAYGFGPIVDDSESDLHGAHSDQERMLESSIHKMVQYLWYTVLDTHLRGWALPEWVSLFSLRPHPIPGRAPKNRDLLFDLRESVSHPESSRPHCCDRLFIGWLLAAHGVGASSRLRRWSP